MKLPGTVVPVLDLPEEFVVPLLVSPIAIICGCVPVEGAATNESTFKENMFRTTWFGLGMDKTSPVDSLRP